MYELAADKDQLVHFLGSLPTGTKLVQVTGDEQPEPLSRVAKRHGIPYGKEPMKEAEAAARLAAHNVGYEVSAFTDTTEVKVSRAFDRKRRLERGPLHPPDPRLGQTPIPRGRVRPLGGKSRVRKGGSGVLRRLRERGVYRRGKPSEIPVSRNRSGDVRVEIERKRQDGIEFRPLVKRRDHVIVGIDPGRRPPSPSSVSRARCSTSGVRERPTPLR